MREDGRAPTIEPIVIEKSAKYRREAKCCGNLNKEQRTFFGTFGIWRYLTKNTGIFIRKKIDMKTI
jgi:hypothetical protein